MGAQQKTKVLLVIAETVEGNPTKKSHRHTAVKHIKMIVIDGLEAETIDAKVKENIEMSSTIIREHSTSYTNFKSIMASHRPQIIQEEKVGEILPWVHIAISNVRSLFLDVYHDIRPGMSRTISASSAGSSTAGTSATPCSTGSSWPGRATNTMYRIN